MTSISPVSAGVRLAGLSLLVVGQLAGAQAIAPASPPEQGVGMGTEAPPTMAMVPAAARLERGTLVNLMVLTEVNSRDSRPGHQFKLRVHQPVTVGGQTVIPEGALAWGEVANAQRTGAVGQAGELGVRLLYVEVDGARIRLNGQRASTGSSAADKVVLSVLGFGLLGLLAKGNNAKLKAGDLVDGHVAETILFVAGQPPVVASPELPAPEKDNTSAAPMMAKTPVATPPAEAARPPIG